MKVAGIVLAGGQSRRFGEHKALALYNGASFLDHSIEALSCHTDFITIVSHPDFIESIKDKYQANVILDLEEYKGQGPLAGILSAMKSNLADWYLVVPCDTPLLKEQMIGTLKDSIEKEMQAIVPVSDEKLQPLIAAYSRSVKPVIEKLLKEDKRSMRDLLNEVKTFYLEEKTFDESAFLNINDKKSLDQLG
ncbi:molybdenum cofactor guanylyltransferase [Metabacillus sp. RGM 3146]|uniref:molybdenum cofactor guanylyltransferase n=1 Tax=Metabacillus sp. RGM 3146 TaxID=3401092 RepID=UPI003B9CDAB2